MRDGNKEGCSGAAQRCLQSPPAWTTLENKSHAHLVHPSARSHRGMAHCSQVCSQANYLQSVGGERWWPTWMIQLFVGTEPAADWGEAWHSPLSLLQKDTDATLTLAFPKALPLWKSWPHAPGDRSACVRFSPNIKEQNEMDLNFCVLLWKWHSMCFLLRAKLVTYRMGSQKCQWPGCPRGIDNPALRPLAWL